MLLHELRSGFWGKYSDARDHIENIDQLMTLVIEYYKKHSKITEEELKDTLTRIGALMNASSAELWMKSIQDDVNHDFLFRSNVIFLT